MFKTTQNASGKLAMGRVVIPLFTHILSSGAGGSSKSDGLNTLKQIQTDEKKQIEIIHSFLVRPLLPLVRHPQIKAD